MPWQYSLMLGSSPLAIDVGKVIANRPQSSAPTCFWHFTRRMLCIAQRELVCIILAVSWSTDENAESYTRTSFLLGFVLATIQWFLLMWKICRALTVSWLCVWCWSKAECNLFIFGNCFLAAFERNSYANPLSICQIQGVPGHSWQELCLEIEAKLSHHQWKVPCSFSLPSLRPWSLHLWVPLHIL